LLCSAYPTGDFALSNQAYWLGLSLVPQLGTVRIQQLLRSFGTAQAAWEATEKELRDVGLPEQVLNSLLKSRKNLDLAAEIRKVEAIGASLITWDDSQYPENLRFIPDAPVLLYLRGQLYPTDMKALAIVGTRKASRYGLDAAQRMAYWLASQEVTIISGMAMGIDAAAHQGALDAKGRTIAVLGSGIDKLYPRENEKLAHAIMAQGAIISEFPIGMPPTANNFPRRNRIISGMSLGVLVAEAPEDSGALITAEAALEQGREVFAIPANIFNRTGAGCNRLIQEGAKLVMKASDVLDELSIAYSKKVTKTKTEKLAPSGDLEKRILALLDNEAIHVDEITRQLGLSSAEVTGTLTLLELKGLAQSLGAMQYCRTR
jgi:DNA processing protein